MIVKEFDPFTSTDPLARAGRRAEEQLAHYLRRAFADRENLWVYNGVRLEQSDDAAQLDHLIVHPYGMIVVESKSVTTKVKINEHGEWLRLFNGHYRGMPSPIEQAKRQGEFLRDYLEARRERLLNRFIGRFQGRFARMPLDVLVAISDDAIIERPRKPELPEVLKAEAVPARIESLLREYKRINSLFNLRLNEVGYQFGADELDRITPFLSEHHRPLNGKIPAGLSSAEPSPPAAITSSHASQVAGAPTPGPFALAAVRAEATAASPQAGVAVAGPIPTCTAMPVCRSCGGARLAATWGKYGYYFKCADCSGNTPIRTDCSVCGAREKIRKDGLTFHAECAPCGTSRVFHRNDG